MVSTTEYRSDVFSMIMQEPKYALQVYNTLNGTSYDDPTLVTVRLNERGFSLSLRNDSTFYVNSDLNLYEHQSTVNPNIPLRQLRYFISEIKEIIKDKDIFSSKLIKLPTPRFAVFYNGTAKQPESYEYRLSTSFADSNASELELICKMYNINPGNNVTMITGCEALSGYQTFVEKTKECVSEGYEPKEAVKSAIDYCVSNGIMVDFFNHKRQEVEKMTLLDYTFERRLELTARDSRAEGFSEGEASGAQKQLIALVQKGLLSVFDAANEAGMTVENFEQLMK